MAIKYSVSKESIKVISDLDEALDTSAPDFRTTYEDYLQTLNESLLKFKPGQEPTRFVMTTYLDLNAQEKIKEKQVTLDENKNPQIRLTFLIEEVRVSLIDIENPADCTSPLVFKKDKDGFASREIMAFLVSHGIDNQLYTARQNAIKAKVDKKN